MVGLFYYVIDIEVQLFSTSVSRYRTYRAFIRYVYLDSLRHFVCFLRGFPDRLSRTQGIFAWRGRSCVSWRRRGRHGRDCPSTIPEQVVLESNGSKSNRQGASRSVSPIQFGFDYRNDLWSILYSRLYLAMVGCALCPAGLFWFAWCVALSSGSFRQCPLTSSSQDELTAIPLYSPNPCRHSVRYGCCADYGRLGPIYH